MITNRIYAFYEPVIKSEIADNLMLIELWETAWRKQGWVPTILNLREAQKHFLYRRFDDHAKTLPTVNNGEFDRLCHVRWLAVERMAQIFNIRVAFTDYDVFPRSDFKPFESEGIFNGDIHSGPGMIVTNHIGYAEIVDAILHYEPKADDTVFGKPHVSDLTILQRNRHLFNHRDLIRCYGVEGWDTVPLVHFGNAYMKRKDLPKHEEIKMVLGL